ncbi:hypothetical protein NC651_028059 [Populus alba x Populus x berolinensis]|nr:hypothetical protein NC651_028059 [Populus alba x Populus x berolinensis]
MVDSSGDVSVGTLELLKKQSDWFDFVIPREIKDVGLGGVVWCTGQAGVVMLASLCGGGVGGVREEEVESGGAVGSKTAQGWVSRMWFLRLGLVQVGLVDGGEEIELK